MTFSNTAVYLQFSDTSWQVFRQLTAAVYGLIVKQLMTNFRRTFLKLNFKLFLAWSADIIVDIIEASKDFFAANVLVVYNVDFAQCV